MSVKKKGYFGRVFDKASSENALLNGVVFGLYKDVFTFKDSEASEMFGGGPAGKAWATILVTLATPWVPAAYAGLTIVNIGEACSSSYNEIKNEHKAAQNSKKNNDYNIM